MNSDDNDTADESKHFDETVNKNTAINSKRKAGNRNRQPTIVKRTKVVSRRMLKKKPKHILKFAESYKIPEHKLRQTLDVINDEDHWLWVDRTPVCYNYIDTYYNKERNAPKPYSAIPFNMKYARQCLLRRDWRNLAKLLSQTQLVGHQYLSYLYSISAKVCLLLAIIELFV